MYDRVLVFIYGSRNIYYTLINKNWILKPDLNTYFYITSTTSLIRTIDARGAFESEICSDYCIFAKNE
jgi:hypothetical protein